jgi:hypothetical protein
MIAECINKLATTSQITHRIADEALDFFQRSQRNYAAPVIAESPPSAFVHAVPEIVRGRVVKLKTGSCIYCRL